MYDVVALGELIIDFTPMGNSPGGNSLFERNPGGAPANVLACLANLGKKTGFIGKVGNDEFGRFLSGVLHAQNIDTGGLLFDSEGNTTLAFVHLMEMGERIFSFYRDLGADTLLRKEEIREELLQTKIFHFGSLSLTHEPARSATLYALDVAKSYHAFISYDPNLRLPLWPSESKAKQQILQVMGKVDLLKLSDEELEFLLGTSNCRKGTRQLYEQFGMQAILVSLGAKGCFYRVGKITGHVPGFSVKSMDTTGAGDGFLGGILYKILEKEIDLSRWTRADLEEAIRFANSVGALVTTRRGAIPAMPSMDEINRLVTETEVS